MPVRFKSHAVVQGNPEFSARATSKPIGFEVGGEGSFKLAIGRMEAEIGEIPIKVTIPFLRRARGVRMVASIGSFGVCLKPFDVEVRGFGVHFGGVLGKEGLEGAVEGKIACMMHLDLAGSVPGRLTKAAIEIADGEDVEAAEE